MVLHVEVFREHNSSSLAGSRNTRKVFPNKTLLVLTNVNCLGPDEICTAANSRLNFNTYESSFKIFEYVLSGVKLANFIHVVGYTEVIKYTRTTAVISSLCGGGGFEVKRKYSSGSREYEVSCRGRIAVWIVEVVTNLPQVMNQTS